MIKSRIDALSNSLPMYQVVGSLLFTIIVAAITCSLFGTISVSPAGIFLSTIVFAGVSVVSSYAFGRVYGTYSHLRSALITGLLLACLFTPSVEVSVLSKYAVIAVIAQASKFVFVHRKRHLFNPAAVGALLAGVLQLGYASWWIATPPLVLVIAFGAAIVLYKTRLGMLGALFLAICLPIGLLKGIDVSVLLTSWPLLFMLGFMVTEPATLPPQKWQQSIVVSVMAVAVSVPFSILNALHSSPELAICIGNIVAFILAYRYRRDLELTFIGRHSLTPTVEELRFSTGHPTNFLPGQYIEISLPHKSQDARGTRRFFSVTSVPGQREVRIGVKFYEKGSSFKRKLRQLEKGEKLASTGIVGDFVLPKAKAEKVLMIAGGIGVTPFISQLQSVAKENRDSVLLYFARNPDELAYRQLLDSFPVTVYYFVAENGTNREHVAAMPTWEIVRKYVNDAQERTVYVSGPPMMVERTKQSLKGKVKKIKTDYFSGY